MHLDKKTKAPRPRRPVRTNTRRRTCRNARPIKPLLQPPCPRLFVLYASPSSATSRSAGPCAGTPCAGISGLLYQHPGRGGHIEGRYSLTVEGDQVVGIECEWCGQKIQLHAAQSIRPLARHFLSESLPFADCPHGTCDQHGTNAFETLPRLGVRGGTYQQATAHDLRCTVCLAHCLDEDCPNEPPLARRCPKGKACPNKPFPLGVALGSRQARRSGGRSTRSSTAWAKGAR